MQAESQKRRLHSPGRIGLGWSKQTRLGTSALGAGVLIHSRERQTGAGAVGQTRCMHLAVTVTSRALITTLLVNNKHCGAVTPPGLEHGNESACLLVPCLVALQLDYHAIQDTTDPTPTLGPVTCRSSPTGAAFAVHNHGHRL